MKNYLIECEHNIYVDSYEQGEGENVNNFDTKGEYSFEKDYMQPDEEQDGKAWYSVLCDVENSEATENQKTTWINDKLTLYANNMTLYVYELIPAII